MTHATQELLAKLEATEARLTQTELDLKSEQNVRRTLQSEAAEAKGREDALVQKQVRPSVTSLARLMLTRHSPSDLLHLCSSMQTQMASLYVITNTWLE